MQDTIAQKILKEHLVEGELEEGAEIGLSIDQTLTQDATGTMVYLEFELLGLNTVKPAVTVSYVDHNIIQTDSRNADDHRFLQSCAAKYGIVFSPPLACEPIFKLPQIYDALLVEIADHLVPERLGRNEPRAVRRERKHYPVLRRTRAEWRKIYAA